MTLFDRIKPYKRPLMYLLVVSMVAVGVMHFITPDPFTNIVPEYMGDRDTRELLVYISGVFEILGGLGLLLPQTRRLSAWGLIALYLAVFPANLNMVITGAQLDPENPLPIWGAWLRLPFQLVFIAFAYWYTRPDEADPEGAEA